MRDIHSEISGLDPLEETQVQGEWVATATLEVDERHRRKTGISTKDRGTVMVNPSEPNNAYSEKPARFDTIWKPTVFISYSKNNVAQRKRLESELKILKNEGLLARDWHDRMTDKGVNDLKDQIIGRIKRYIACNSEVQREFDGISLDEEFDTGERWAMEARIKRAHEIPFSVYGIASEDEIDEKWVDLVDPLLIEWCHGRSSNWDCRNLFQELNATYDLDPFYFLYGLPAGELSGMSMRYLTSFIYEFGTRNHP